MRRITLKNNFIPFLIFIAAILIPTFGVLLGYLDLGIYTHEKNNYIDVIIVAGQVLIVIPSLVLLLYAVVIKSALSHGWLEHVLTTLHEGRGAPAGWDVPVSRGIE
jgi:hypothetical protein